MKSLAIMQPTFMPWVGYFALIDAVDQFVFLDHVQFDKRSWQQRNQIKTPNGPLWLTAPVVSKGKARQSINEVEINQASDDYPDKIIKTIIQNYSKTDFFDQYSGAIFDLLHQNKAKLIDINIGLIHYFCDQFKIKKPVSFSSEMDVAGQKSALLVDICQKCDATAYLSPPGSKEYIDASDDFDRANINVSYFHYNHPEWKQPYGDFMPYMSALDLLFNMGDKSIEIIRQGVDHEALMRDSRP